MPFKTILQALWTAAQDIQEFVSCNPELLSKTVDNDIMELAIAKSVIFFGDQGAIQEGSGGASKMFTSADKNQGWEMELIADEFYNKVPGVTQDTDTIQHSVHTQQSSISNKNIPPLLSQTPTTPIGPGPTQMDFMAHQQLLGQMSQPQTTTQRPAISPTASQLGQIYPTQGLTNAARLPTAQGTKAKGSSSVIFLSSNDKASIFSCYCNQFQVTSIGLGMATPASHYNYKTQAQMANWEPVNILLSCLVNIQHSLLWASTPFGYPMTLEPNQDFKQFINAPKEYAMSFQEDKAILEGWDFWINHWMCKGL